MKTKKFKKIGLEVTYPIEFTETYKIIKVPKGWRLPELWELFRIAQFDREFLKLKDWNWYFANQTKKDKKNKIIRGLYLGRNLDLGSFWGDLGSSNANGRVVFVRDLE